MARWLKLLALLALAIAMTPFIAFVSACDGVRELWRDYAIPDLVYAWRDANDEARAKRRAWIRGHSYPKGGRNG